MRRPLLALVVLAALPAAALGCQREAPVPPPAATPDPLPPDSLNDRSLQPPGDLVPPGELAPPAELVPETTLQP